MTYVYIWLPLTIFFIIIFSSAIKVSEFYTHLLVLEREKCHRHPVTKDNSAHVRLIKLPSFHKE